MRRIHTLMSILALSLLAAVLVLAQGGTNPVPLINEPLAPSALAPTIVGIHNQVVTINGTGFVAGSVVNWNRNAVPTTFVNSSQLTAAIPNSDLAQAETATVTVVNPAPGGGASNVAFLPITTAAGTVVVSQSGIFQSGGAPGQAAGDFNGDGKLDLAITDSAGIQVLLGNGDGTFQPPVFYPVSGGTFFVIVGDFNGDGKLDIAAEAGIDTHLRSVAILLGNGDGTFQAPIFSSLDTSLSCGTWLAAGDFNGDGKLDLAVGYGCGSAAISVLLGNGNGTFQPFVDYPTASEPRAIAVGDFNGDGKLDIATANFGNFAGHTVSILLGNGDGTFQPHVEYQADGGAEALVAADFNGDGKLDLAVDCACGHSTTACGRPGTVAVLLGNGDGTFKAPAIYDVDEYPNMIATADFTGDGKLDLAVADFDSAKISFLLGNGDGTFQPHFEVSLVDSLSGLSGGPVGVLAGDFNGDGLLDLVTDGRPSSLGGSIDEVRLFLQAKAPVAALSSASLSFASQDVGSTSAAQTVTLNNPGRAQLATSSISIGGANGSDFAANTGTCLSGVAPGANCTLNFTFTPSASGPRAGLLSITDNAGNSPQTVALSGMGEDFGVALASGSSSSATVTAGGTASYTLSVSPQGGFNQTINLSCAGAPTAATCTPSPASPTLDGTNSQNVTVNVTTTARGMLPPLVSHRRVPGAPAAPLVLVCAVALVIALALTGTRRLRPQTTFALLVLFTISLAACGGGSSAPPPPTGTPAGTYTLTIRGTSGSLSHKTTVTLNVN